jgi:hypothetical protein
MSCYYLKQEVDRLFAQAPDRHASIRRNPVTGGRWLRGVDSIVPQKRRAERALLARQRAGLPPGIELPLTQEEWERMRWQGAPKARLVGFYARSLAHNDWFMEDHPSFSTYASGLLASPHAAQVGLFDNLALAAAYPPRELPGLDAGLIYRPGRVISFTRKANSKNCRDGR